MHNSTRLLQIRAYFRQNWSYSSHIYVIFHAEQESEIGFSLSLKISLQIAILYISEYFQKSGGHLGKSAFLDILPRGFLWISTCIIYRPLQATMQKISF